MSNKLKKQNISKAKEEQYKKNINKNSNSKIEKVMGKMENHLNNISDHNKYKERIKTSYISMFLYLILIAIYFNYEKQQTFSLALLLSGGCICIYNIIKSILSIKDKKSIKHNKILIVLQGLFILLFIWIFFYGGMLL